MKTRFRFTPYSRIFLWFLFWLLIICASIECLIRQQYPWRFTSLEPYLLKKPNDDWNHNAFLLQKLKETNLHDFDRSYLFLGGSAAIEAITSDEEMKERLKELTGKKIGFMSITSSFKSFSDEAKILEKLGEFQGTVIIPVEPWRFIISADIQLQAVDKNGVRRIKYYYLPNSEKILNILKKHGKDVTWSDRLCIFQFSEVFGELLKKKILRCVHLKGKLKAIKYDRHIASKNKVFADDKLIASLSNKLKKSEAYRNHHEVNFELLDEIVRICKKNKCHVVWLELPTNPLLADDFKVFAPNYDNRVQKYLLKAQIGFIDMQKYDWQRTDFHDQSSYAEFWQGKIYGSTCKSVGSRNQWIEKNIEIDYQFSEEHSFQLSTFITPLIDYY